MKTKFSISLLLAFLCAFSINTIEAQTKESKKVVIKKKTIDKDGKETIEVKEMSSEEADVFILEQEGQAGEEIEIEIEMDGDAKKQHEKEVKIITMDSDGEKKVIKWNGEGEMPDEVKAVMKEHEIDIEALKKESEEQSHKKVKAKFIDEDGNEKVLEWEGEGEMPEDIKKMMEEKGTAMELETESRYKIKIMGDDGEMQEMEWNGEGEMPAEMKAIMDKHEINVERSAGKDHDVVKIITKEVEDGNKNKAQLGIMISPAETGVAVMDFVDGSPAQKSGLTKGDVITKLDGKTITSMQDLIDSLSDKKAGDSVKLEYTRDGKSNETLVPLTNRTVQTEKTFQWKQIEKN